MSQIWTSWNWSQYLIWPPLEPIQAMTRLLIEKVKSRMASIGIRCHKFVANMSSNIAFWLSVTLHYIRICRHVSSCEHAPFFCFAQGPFSQSCVKYLFLKFQSMSYFMICLHWSLWENIWCCWTLQCWKTKSLILLCFNLLF